ncbi:LOW QUALITY PROTEIN: UDP-glucuronosyltransferase 3A1-like [Anableps anableps]
MFSILALPLLHSAKILAVCLIRGSHFLLLVEISHTLHQQAHEVCMFLQLGNPVITDFSYAAREDSYRRSTWSLGEKYIKEYNDWFLEEMLCLCLSFRENFNGFLNFMAHLSFQCDKLLEEKITNFLLREHYDVAILDAFNPCSFVLAHRLASDMGHL